MDLPPRVCREIARIVQEALRNVRKHSRAQNVLVRFERAPSGWRLVVDDDGQGFAAFNGTLTHAELDDGRKGPYVIKERVRALGGELTITTSAGGGSRLDILLPDEASMSAAQSKPAPRRDRRRPPDLPRRPQPAARGRRRLRGGGPGLGRDEAVRLARELSPDVLLLDLAMPRVSGLDALRELSTRKEGRGSCC